MPTYKRLTSSSFFAQINLWGGGGGEGPFVIILLPLGGGGLFPDKGQLIWFMLDSQSELL